MMISVLAETKERNAATSDHWGILKGVLKGERKGTLSLKKRPSPLTPQERPGIVEKGIPLREGKKASHE